MKKIEMDDTRKIQGGLSFLGGVGIVGIALFIVGILDGFTRPIKCN